MKLPEGVIDARERFAARCLAVARRLDAAAHDAGRNDSGESFERRSRRALGLGERTFDTSGLGPVAPSATGHTLLVPGLFGDSVRFLVAPFACSSAALAADGHAVGVAWVNGRAGCDANARTLRAHVLDAASSHGAPVNVIGYSKGCTDVLHMLANWPDTRPALRSLVSLAGVIGGTPLANDSARWLDALVRWVPVPGAGFGDGRALDDLDPDYRRAHLARHPLPASIRCASLVARPAPGNVSRVLRSSWRRIAAHDPRNDAQVIDADALLPRGEYLGSVDADHWAIALPIVARHPWLGRWFVDRNDCPREVLLRALIEHLAVTPAAAAPAAPPAM